MTTKQFFAALALLFCLSAVSRAQDQVEIINDPPKYLDPALAPKSPEISLTSARTLIEKTLGPKFVTDSGYYTIIHILKWKTNQTVVDSQHWYVFNSGTWSNKQFDGTRIFGSHKVALLYIHLNAQGVPNASQPDKDTAMTAVGLTSVNNRKLILVSENLLLESDYANITYRVEVTKKLPAPVQGLSALLGLAQGSSGALTKVEPVAFWGGRELVVNDVPSDVTVRALSGESGVDAKELGKATFDNEGRYYWDISVGMPVSKIKELTFDASDGTVRPKEIDKQKLFAMINIFFKPIDTKGVKPNLFPHLLAGVALSKKPLDRIFVGAGLGINKVQFFAGVAFNRVVSPQTLTPGAQATASQLEADLRFKYEPKFVVGLNLPVRQVVDALKAKK